MALQKTIYTEKVKNNFSEKTSGSNLEKKKNILPFFKWGNFKSVDLKNPDIVEFKVSETKTFDTEYSTNIKIQQNTDKQWNEVILSLKSHSSNNLKLLSLWNNAIKSRSIRIGTKFKLKTWLGISKNNRTIRRFEIVF